MLTLKSLLPVLPCEIDLNYGSFIELFDDRTQAHYRYDEDQIGVMLGGDRLGIEFEDLLDHEVRYIDSTPNHLEIYID